MFISRHKHRRTVHQDGGSDPSRAFHRTHFCERWQLGVPSIQTNQNAWWQPSLHKSEAECEPNIPKACGHASAMVLFLKQKMCLQNVCIPCGSVSFSLIRKNGVCALTNQLSKLAWSFVLMKPHDGQHKQNQNGYRWSRSQLGEWNFFKASVSAKSGYVTCMLDIHLYCIDIFWPFNSSTLNTMQGIENSKIRSNSL